MSFLALACSVFRPKKVQRRSLRDINCASINKQSQYEIQYIHHLVRNINSRSILLLLSRVCMCNEAKYHITLKCTCQSLMLPRPNIFIVMLHNYKYIHVKGMEMHWTKMPAASVCLLNAGSCCLRYKAEFKVTQWSPELSLPHYASSH